MHFFITTNFQTIVKGAQGHLTGSMISRIVSCPMNYSVVVSKQSIIYCDVKGFWGQSSVRREKKYFQLFLSIYIERSGIQKRAKVLTVSALSMLTKNCLTTVGIANFCT